MTGSDYGGPVITTLLVQAVVTLALAGVLWLWQGQVTAVSALLGGLTVLLPNAFLAARLLRAGTGQGGMQLLRAAWIGEIGKLVITVIMFAVIFTSVRPLAPLAVFGGFIAAQLVVFGVLLFGGGAGYRQQEKN